MSEIRRKLSLQYLKQPLADDPQRGVSTRDSGVTREALVTYGQPILQALARRPSRMESLHTIIDEVDITISTALLVVDFMKKDSLIEFVTSDERRGNHLLRLTEKGRLRVGRSAGD